MGLIFVNGLHDFRRHIVDFLVVDSQAFVAALTLAALSRFVIDWRLEEGDGAGAGMGER